MSLIFTCFHTNTGIKHGMGLTCSNTPHIERKTPEEQWVPEKDTYRGYSRGHREMLPAPWALINKDWRRTWPSRLSKVYHRRKGRSDEKRQFQWRVCVCKGLGAWGRLEYLWKCGGSALTRLCHHGMWQREANIEVKMGQRVKGPCEPQWDFLVCCQINGKPLKRLTIQTSRKKD